MSSRSEALVLALVLSCGYAPVYGDAASDRLHVKVVRALVADPVAAEEVAAGMREELAREGALGAGEGYPRIEVEILRAGETSEGIAAGAAGPRARGSRSEVAARAWLTRSPGATAERDTGDVTDGDTIAVDGRDAVPDPRAAELHGADALRSAARRLGRTLARRVTGEHPVPALGEGPAGSP